MEISEFIKRQKDFSKKTFGPGSRQGGILKHIEKEIAEVRQELKLYMATAKYMYRQNAMKECVDIIILATDLAWRLGFEPHEIETALQSKQSENMQRKWPPYQSFTQDDPIEHEEEE